MIGSEEKAELTGIAIIGMAGRFPGAANVGQFWENLKNGVESISRFAIEELEIRNASEQAKAPNYVRARAILDDIDQFDPAFFGILPQEARLIDPQHRIFLECCWEAFEDAGHDPASGSAITGVFAGCSPNSYFQTQVCQDREFAEDYAAAYQVGFYHTMLGAIADTLATRVAYKLNLQGPSVTVLSACSTSLVAIAQACSSLLTYQCDQALAGGVSITLPQKRGYLYEPGGMVSPDGHCRTFDAAAQGTVFGSGAGVVLLKRLEDAVADGDHIYAVVKGFAVNNDGAEKVGFTAPGVSGQAKVIAMAQAVAGVDPRSIGYIEAHGTATPLGDPIEIAALTQAFRAGTADRGFCAIGTAKTNVGHLDCASGVTGLIKTALSLKHGLLPPTLHFEKPNPKLDLENSPFYVNTKLREWKSSGGQPRRAGVSAFGVGGTNAHVVLEEAAPVSSESGAPSSELIVLSARSPEALRAAASNLADHFERNADLSLAEAAYTLQTGRRQMPYRLAIVAANVRLAVEVLRSAQPRGSQQPVAALEPAVHFLFPGQGAQYVNMGRKLYETEPVFRSHLDRCAEILKPALAADLRDVIYPRDGATEENRRRLEQTIFAQSAIFVVEYALAQLWMHWGVRPRAMAGHSIGEFVAACLADVFSLEDALALVAARARLMQDLPAGAMLSVRLPESETLPLLGAGLSLAAINAPSLCVVSGPLAAVAALERNLGERKVACRRLPASHAFHSSMMDPVIAPFGERVSRVRLSAPRIPFVSTVTGGWISETDATDPAYWARHLRQPVRFADAVAEFCGKPEIALLEAGPGSTLQTLARQQPRAAGQTILSSLPGESGRATDNEALLQALGGLWTAGVQPDWNALHEPASRRRVPLPTYPFERQRYWIESKTPPETNPVPGDPILMNCEPTTATTGIEPDHRKQRILAKLLDVFQELSGMDRSQIEPAAAFLELGFDSLFLTQASQAIQSEFGLKITFRQLVEQQQTLEAVAGYLDEKLPAEALPAPAPPVAVRPPAPGVAEGAKAASSDAIERIMKEQLQTVSQLVSQQLEFLRNGASAAPAGSMTPQQPSAVPAPPEPAARESEPKAVGPFKPIQKSVPGSITGRQHAYLTALIERYSRQTAGSKRLTQQHRQRLADPRVVSGFRSQWKEIVYPIVTNRSRGSRLWDVDGNEYIDLLNGFGPTAFGHAPDFVVDAIQKQLRDGFEIGPQTPLAGRVATMLCEMTGMERATFCNTGSEAVMAAMRLARTVTGRKKIVLFAGDYHGNFDEVLTKRIGPASALRCGSVAPGIPSESVQNMISLDYGAPESLAIIREHAHELAAVMVEPVQSRHLALQPREFLGELREITAASGTALIFDEIVTGFRVHPGGAQALFDIKADLATYGKVLGGGMPIGVLAGKAAFMDALDGGMWQYGDDSCPEVGVTFFAGTFVRHPLALAAAEAVLEHLKASGPGLQERLTARTTEFAGRLNGLFEKYGAPARVESFGSIFYFSFAAGFRFGSLLYYHMREKGVHIQEGFPCFLTTAHSDADLDLVVCAFDESFAEMQAGGVLPAPAAPAIPVANEIRQAPLTEAQLEVWLSAQLGPSASCAFNETFTLTLRGDLNEQALRTSLREIVSRHEGLRATFSSDGSTAHFSPQLDPEVRVIDLRDAAGPKQEVGRALEEEASTPFDLATGPLVRMKLLRLAAREHVLVFTSHHIVCDGWSTNVILDELSKLYAANVRGGSANLTAPLAFSVFAQRQRSDADGSGAAAIAKYWLDQFRELPPLLDLPLDRSRPGVKGFAGATVRKTIGPEQARAIQRAGAKKGCTLFVTLLAGFEALLFRLTNQNDIVVGIPAAGQSLLEDETLVGHCVNFLPVRARLAESATFAGLLAAGKKVLLDAYDHQQYTYGTLVRNLSTIRDPGRLPLVEVQFNLEKMGTGLHFPGLDVEVDSGPKSFANFDLFLNIREGSNGLSLDCDYNSEIFDGETIGRWLGHYETLLAAAVADMDCPVSRLPLLTDAERRLLLVERNKTESEYPHGKCIHQLFAEQVAKTPKAVAAVFENQSLTYAELNNRANNLANFLKEQGVTTNQTVAIYVERSIEMLVAVLGVLKAGATYIPLDPSYPRERIDFILQEAKVKVALTQEILALDLGRIEARIVCLDSDWALISRYSSTEPAESADPGDSAYLIYTSGSTGKPKGVEIPHRAVVNLLYSMLREPGIQAKDRLLAVTTLSFDISGLELFLPLVTGARVVIAGRDAVGDGNRLVELIAQAGISMLQATPSTWRLLLEAGWKPSPSLKMLCGGEELPRDLANQLLEGGAELWNMYGPTETTIWSAVCRVERTPERVPIGPPIANTRFYVLDSRREPAPVGVPGELYIGGDGLARGYLQRPELTDEKFVADPFGAGARVYRTGDLVRALPNGTLEFLGRLDHQVKIRGFRIELGEIEAALARHPDVREVVVSVREDGAVKRLAAYFTTAQGRELNPGEVEDFVSRSLPGYMVPSFFITLEAIPRTPNGKVDRRALPPPDPNRAAPAKAFRVPRSQDEEKLAAICAEVLSVERISIDDDLFQLGADSIQLFQIVARANRAGLHVTVQQLLRYPTIEGLSNLEQTVTKQPDLGPIKRVSRAGYRVERASSPS
jgi:amino acid adenylation domain-containing protein